MGGQKGPLQTKRIGEELMERLPRCTRVYSPAIQSTIALLLSVWAMSDQLPLGSPYCSDADCPYCKELRELEESYVAKHSRKSNSLLRSDDGQCYSDSSCCRNSSSRGGRGSALQDEEKSSALISGNRAIGSRPCGACVTPVSAPTAAL